jgi:hypothetical protein
VDIIRAITSAIYDHNARTAWQHPCRALVANKAGAAQFVDDRARRRSYYLSTLTQLSSLDLSTCGWGNEKWPHCGCENNWDPNDDIVTYISGPLAALSPLTQLREIHLNGSTSNGFGFHLNHITGSVSALAQLTQLTSLNIANALYNRNRDNDNTSLCNQVTGEMPLWMLRDHERVTINVADNLVTLPYDTGKLHTTLQ